MQRRGGAEHLSLASFDLIVSDVLMPAMDGFQLCRRVKADERLKHIPFVFYTATYTARQDEEHGLALSASRFIVKPVEPEEFLAVLEQVMHEGEAGTIMLPAVDLDDDGKSLSVYNQHLVRIPGRVPPIQFWLSQNSPGCLSLPRPFDRRT